MSKGTVLRFIKANSPDSLTEIIGALPFKVEVKSIQKDGKSWLCFFTMTDEKHKITNDQLGRLNG